MIFQLRFYHKGDTGSFPMEKSRRPHGIGRPHPIENPHPFHFFFLTQCPFIVHYVLLTAFCYLGTSLTMLFIPTETDCPLYHCSLFLSSRRHVMSARCHTSKSHRFVPFADVSRCVVFYHPTAFFEIITSLRTSTGWCTRSLCQYCWLVKDHPLHG